MRTTINIDDQILAIAKHRAIEQGVTLTSIIENALRDTLFKTEKKTGEIQLLTVKGAGVKPGIDLGHSSSLLDIMDDL
jgi:hypothetical protein